MIVQSAVLPDDICQKKELYFHTAGDVEIDKSGIWMKPDARLDSYTYMNVFDAYTWTKYTGIKNWFIKLKIVGKGNVRLISKCYSENGSIQKKQLYSQDVNNKEEKEITCAFESSGVQEQIFLEIEAQSEMKIREIQYAANAVENAPRRDIHLGVVICTYKRNTEVKDNLKRLEESEFFNPKSHLFGKMSIRIVDNASELPEIQQDFMKLYHNPNTGGSGGFTRGVIESRKEESKHQITNVVFMDDDVKFIMESFYRLYALLSYMRDEYREEVIAGRMFRMDERHIQYTAAEIWNRGNIRHIGWNEDMTDVSKLDSVNDNAGAEYSGWWFACFPMGFVRENTPLPFFLHCDDVEYGLRHGGTPIILNGIQVWHETYEYRQSPIMAYYDIRNPLIVNAIYGLLPEKEQVLAEWKKKISVCHAKGDYQSEYMMILGLWDFCKWGKEIDSVNAEKNHKRICKKKGYKYKNAFFWRYTENVFARRT